MEAKSIISKRIIVDQWVELLTSELIKSFRDMFVELEGGVNSGWSQKRRRKNQLKPEKDN